LLRRYWFSICLDLGFIWNCLISKSPFCYCCWQWWMLSYCFVVLIFSCALEKLSCWVVWSYNFKIAPCRIFMFNYLLPTKTFSVVLSFKCHQVLNFIFNKIFFIITRIFRRIKKPAGSKKEILKWIYLFFHYLNL
jgi:hypothetical protein